MKDISIVSCRTVPGVEARRVGFVGVGFVSRMAPLAGTYTGTVLGRHGPIPNRELYKTQWCRISALRTLCKKRNEPNGLEIEPINSLESIPRRPRPAPYGKRLCSGERLLPLPMPGRAFALYARNHFPSPARAIGVVLVVCKALVVPTSTSAWQCGRERNATARPQDRRPGRG